MKKTIIAIAVVAAGVLVGAPYITGSVAESETRTAVDSMNAKSAQYGSLEIVNYERGFRSSQVSYEYELPAGWAVMTQLEGALKYDCEYAHGIMGIDYHCHFRANEGYAKFVAENFGGEDPVSITGEISAFGGVTQEITSKAIDKSVDGGSVLQIDSSRIFIESDSSFSVFDSTAEIGKIKVVDEKGEVAVEPSTVSWKIIPTESGLYEGDYSLETGALNIIADDNKVMMSDLAITGSNLESDGKMDSSVQMSFDRISAEGPESVSFEDGRFSMGFLGLSSAALLEYQEFIMTLQTDIMANVEQGGEPNVDPNQLMALLPIVEKMLDKDLNLKMAASGKLMGKPNSFDMDVKLLEKTSFAQLSAFMFNPESVLKNFDIQLSASLNKELIGDHPAAGPFIEKSPLFTHSDKNYEAKIKLGAESQVNGKKVSFEELQGMVMSGLL